MERFVAYYEGKAIAKSRALEKLMNMRAVKSLLGERELMIRRVTPEGAKIVYKGGIDKTS